MKNIYIIFLCFILFCGNVYSQSVQETNDGGYSPWSVNAFSLISTELDQTNQGGMLNSYNYVGPNYRLNANERLAFKAAFIANSTGHDRFNAECVQDQDMNLDNPFIEYNNYNLGFLPGLVDIFWSGRVYLPLSKSMREKKTIARYRSNAIFTRWITQKVFIEYRNDINFFQQSKTTYTGTHTEDCQPVANNNPSNTSQYSMDNWINFWYQMNQTLSFGLSLILEEQFYNSTNAFETSRQRDGRMRERSASLGPSVRYNHSDKVNFILSIRDVSDFSGFSEDRKDSLKELGQFKSKNAELSLLSFIRF